MKKLILVLIGCFLATGAVAAETQGFQLSLIPDIAIQARTTRIKGVSLNIWGENPQNAIALGLVNGSTGDSSGVSVGLLANYAETYEGAQLAWFANYSSVKLTGFQWAAFNYAAKLHGLQLGFINFAESSDKGVQVGLINIMNNTKDWFRNFPNEIAPVMVLVNWRF
ncbi:LA_2272 family surface repeat-containing protein [Geopsychrobacter electrodiphilus]|uniref:LA_2272 family surface repeat-containing protein n=1 Tax=Geopsychrobacter electrodiphilus TaxID=225196 RepID=UPI000368AB38|nr:hypothetical protein [Geopsychrobacter electrodiphilus]